MELEFRAYREIDRDPCLSLFDANCPASFAPNEREDYCAFLDGIPATYIVVSADAAIVGAFGVAAGDSNARLSWIMVDPRYQRAGIGMAIMAEAVDRARQLGFAAIDIAASHLSAPFFGGFGADLIRYTNGGWGPGMHRIDMVLPLASGMTEPDSRRQDQNMPKSRS